MNYLLAYLLLGMGVHMCTSALMGFSGSIPLLFFDVILWPLTLVGVHGIGKRVDMTKVLEDMKNEQRTDEDGQ